MIELTPTDPRRVALESENVVFATLLKLDFPAGAGGTMYLTDFGRDLVVGGNTYTSNSDLYGTTPPPAQGVGERTFADIIFVDPDGDWNERFTSHGHTGIRLQFQVVFVADTGEVSMPLDIFRGRCVQATKQTEDGILQVLARFAGPIVKLDSDASVLASDNQQRQRRANDNSLQYIAIARDIAWGKKI